MSINRVVLVGRLTKDVDIRMTQSGNKMANFTLAVNRNKTGKGGQIEADFIRCVAYNKTAENMEKYTHKGSQIGIEGRIQTGSYKDRDGKTVYMTDIACELVQFLDPKENSYQPTTPPPFSKTMGRENPFTTQEEPVYDPSYDNDGLEVDSDDLPF